jgi:putative aminopeptidase FrvX
VSGSDLQALFAAVASAAGVAAPSTIVAPRAMPGLVAERRDSLSREADLLARLTDRYAVSTHEGSVRAVVMSELPAWARARATVDSGGNIVVSAGPDRDTVVIMAHMDEVGLEVTNVLPNGMVALKAVGGFFPTLFAGQPALLHRDDDRQAAPSLRDCAASSASATRGVFVPEDSTRQRAVYAWFGDDPASLGIAPGMFVTGYKCAARLGDLRFTARSIDDRAGSTALLLAINAIDPAKLDHKVVFAWSTREEIGLNGAAALAAQLRTNVKRVYAIDTFVSSDSPLENQAFADTPIGQGAVARMLDNSSVTPPQDIQALVQLARAQRIPLQVGTTNGGNDGSEFTRYGAVDVPIGWPLRNSHSPAEVIDLRDVRSLWKLLVAIAQAPVPPFAR